MSRMCSSVLGLALLMLAAAPVDAQESFAAGSCKPKGLGEDASICGDAERISRIERELNATARAFPLAGSQTAQGRLGRYLETNNYAVANGVCLKRPDRVILFLSDARMCESNRIAEQYASRPDGDQPGGGSPGGGLPRRTEIQPPPPPPASIAPSIGKPMKIGPGAGPCLPYGRGGYDYCQNAEGTWRPPGCICRGPKAVTRTRLPPTEPPPFIDPQPGIKRNPPPVMLHPPSDGELFQAINKCLSFVPWGNRRLYYYEWPPVAARPRKQSSDTAVSYEHGAIFYDAAYLARLPPAARALAYADAFAQHAQALHDKRFGPDTDNYTYDDGLDQVDRIQPGLLDVLRGDRAAPRHKMNTTIAVGFIYRCLQRRNLVPDYPDATRRDARDDFLDAQGLDWNSVSRDGTDGPSTRLRAFSVGYQLDALAPTSLLPPRP